MTHVPTQENRRLVESFKAFGVTNEQLCEYLGISENTLRKYYATEMAQAEVKANVRVAQNLYQTAMRGNVSAMIFWLKTRAGWRETDRLEIVQSVDVNITMARVELARRLLGADAPEVRDLEMLIEQSSDEDTDADGRRPAGVPETENLGSPKEPDP